MPAGTRSGHIHLQINDPDRALAFYQGLLGFELMLHGEQAAFLSADGYFHHIGLNTWHSQGGRPAVRNSVAGWTEGAAPPA